MRPRRVYALVAVAVLVLLNLWRWWPVVQSRAGGAGAPPIAPADLTLRSRVDKSTHTRPARDLFYATRSAPVVHRTSAQRALRPKRQKVDPEKAAYLAAQAALGQYQLAGVAFHNKTWQALLVRGEQNLTVSRGDEIDGRFSVTAITNRSVTLQDRRTKATVLLRMSTD